MKKCEQRKINDVVLEKWETAKTVYSTIPYAYKTKRLRSCSANVVDYDGYYYLISYNTIVAFIDKTTNICYDILRYVYGYTATSAQHIAKFEQDYGDEYTYRNRMTYYPVG